MKDPIRMGYRVSALFAAVLLSVACGCGPSNLATHEVIGSVEFDDGTIAKFGNIEFYSAAHKINARGKIERDGSFTVTTYTDGDGAVEGMHDVIIMQQVGSYQIAKAGSTIKHDHGALIDTKYFDYQTSGLSCEVTPGSNEIQFVLKKLKKQTPDGLPHSH